MLMSIKVPFPRGATISEAHRRSVPQLTRRFCVSLIVTTHPSILNPCRNVTSSAHMEPPPQSTCPGHAPGRAYVTSAAPDPLERLHLSLELGEVGFEPGACVVIGSLLHGCLVIQSRRRDFRPLGRSMGCTSSRCSSAAESLRCRDDSSSGTRCAICSNVTRVSRCAARSASICRSWLSIRACNASMSSWSAGLR